MIEAAMIWNEPNNKSHWDLEVDPDWSRFADTVIRAGSAIGAVNPAMTRVLGGMSPIDPVWVRQIEAHGALDAVDVVAVHGFPLDWNLWSIHDWPARIAEIEAVTTKPIWVTEVGVGSFGAEEVQVFGVRRTAELLLGRVPRVFWYSLFDLPMEWGATTRHREAEGSSYYRHFYMGLIRPDGSPKPGLDEYARVAGEMGLMQWFHYHDPRLDDAVAWMKRLGTRRLRTGLSWADSFRPDAIGWFDRQMEALADFDVTVTFCFTPEHLGIQPHHTSAARDPQAFADFCASMIERYAPAAVAPPAAMGTGSILPSGALRAKRLEITTMTDDARRKVTDNAFDTPQGYAGQAYSREREAAQGRTDAGEAPGAEPGPPPPEDPDAFGTDRAASTGATIAPPEEDEAARLGDFA